MKPLTRMPVNKVRSARKFRKQASRTKVVNLKGQLTRGGMRF